MTKKERPVHIRIAIAHDDLQQLRISGAAGGRKAAEVKREKKARREAEDAFFREKREAEETRRKEATNEHIVPLDSDIAHE
jgi:hypothetical protein